MIVCIAEKPSVAKDIANVLGAKKACDGYIEGNGYQVTWTYGHLCELKEPHEYDDAWKKWDMGVLPMIPVKFGIKVKDDKGIRKQFKTVEGLMKKASEIINCGDAGQEGELIQRWVMQKAGAKCPVKRLWISSLTEEAIREGFRNLRPQDEYEPLYLAGLSRAVGDWVLGMNATRLYTLKYGGYKQVLSIGRVQTPTLALIVNRQLEIRNFRPEPYWELKTKYRGVTFSSVKGRYTSSEECREALSRVSGKDFTVTLVEQKQGLESFPKLFDLTSLQVECNRRFGYSAEFTLSQIQSLYEKKVATYPRVDTTFLSDDIYPKCPSILKGLRGYERFTAPLEGKPLIKSRKVFDSSKVTDHHAIIPTGVTPSGLKDSEQKVYDLIALRFIAAFYPDCKVANSTVMGRVEDVEFKVTGRQVLEPGWRSVLQPGKEEDTDDKAPEENTLPAFARGEKGPHEPSLLQKTTTPPKPYTEATLLRAMETAGKTVEDEALREALKENGIGRPSTRAAIIETLFRRKYIAKDKKNLIATVTGIELIGIIRQDILKSAELTGQWERKLRLIEHRKYDAAAFMEELKDMVRDIVAEVKADNTGKKITSLEERAKQQRKPGASARASASSAPRPAASALGIRKGGVASDGLEGRTCPMCFRGKIVRGAEGYECSRKGEGCRWRKAF